MPFCQGCSRSAVMSCSSAHSVRRQGTSVPSCVCVCPTLCGPRDCSPPGSSAHGRLQARTLRGLPCPLQGIPGPGTEPRSHCRRILYQLSHQGHPLSHSWMLTLITEQWSCRLSHCHYYVSYREILKCVNINHFSIYWWFFPESVIITMDDKIISVLTLTWYISKDKVQWEGPGVSRARQGCHLLATCADARATGGDQGPSCTKLQQTPCVVGLLSRI